MDNNNKSIEEQVEEIIETDIRPFIEADGGMIDLIEVDPDGVVYVALSGACSGCPGASMTLKGGVERILKSRIHGVSEVRLGY